MTIILLERSIGKLLYKIYNSERIAKPFLINQKTKSKYLGVCEIFKQNKSIFRIREKY